MESSSSSGGGSSSSGDGEKRKCVGMLFAHYVKHNRTKDGKEQIIAKGPSCYGVSWKASKRSRAKTPMTLDRVESELGKAGTPLRLDWACTGISSYNTRVSATSGGAEYSSEGASAASKVELPQCGGIEFILSNELEFKSAKAKEDGRDRRIAEAQNRAQGVKSRMRTGDAAEEARAERDYVHVQDQMREVRKFANNWMVSANKIANKMSENLHLCANVIKNLFPKL